MAILTSPSTLYQAGVGPLATLFDAVYPVPENGLLPGLGLMRRSPYFDPIFPGTPKDSWGVSAGAQAGFVNPAQGTPSQNIVAVSPAAPGVPQGVAGTAPLTSVTRLRVGISDLLEVTHLFDWASGAANENVVQVAVTIRNISGTPQAVRYRRDVDWDVAAIVILQERTNFPAVTGFPPPLVGVARDGLATVPSPLAPLVLPVSPAGGDFGPPTEPGDQGHVFDLDFGMLPDGGTAQTTFYYAVAPVGGSQSALRAQLEALLACEYVATSYSTADAQRAAALAVAVPCVVVPCCPCTGGGGGDTVVTPCCNGAPIPTRLYLTLVGLSITDCTCWSTAVPVLLTYNPTAQSWIGTFPTTCLPAPRCSQMTARFGCRPNDFRWGLVLIDQGDFGHTGFDAVTFPVSCTPFLWQAVISDNPIFTGTECCSLLGPINATISQ